MRRALLLAALALITCGGRDSVPEAAPMGAGPEEARPAPGRPEAGAPPPVAARGVDWDDPEPAGAQARAEGALTLDGNRDKTSRLTMHMTTLVDRRTGLTGFRTQLTGAERTLEQRLADLDARISATEVVIRLPGSVLFDFDSDAIRPDAERTLLELVAVLQAEPGRKVRVEGHTDSIASESYNLDLSRRRGESVLRWLVAHGVAASRLTATGMGESQPVADNGTAAGRQLNRRVEVVIERGA